MNIYIYIYMNIYMYYMSFFLSLLNTQTNSSTVYLASPKWCDWACFCPRVDRFMPQTQQVDF